MRVSPPWTEIASIALALPSQEDAEQGVAQGEELTHQAPFDGVEALVLVGGLLDQGDDLLELLLLLERGLFFGEDHGGASWGGDIV